MKKWGIVCILVIALIVIETVPMVTVMYEEPYTATETYEVEVPYTEAEIEAWRKEHTPPSHIVNIDDLTVGEILDILSGKNNPEIPPMPPNYETRTKEVIKWREIPEKVTILKYLVR